MYKATSMREHTWYIIIVPHNYKDASIFKLWENTVSSGGGRGFIHTCVSYTVSND